MVTWLLFLLAFVVVDAVAQGHLTLLFRRYVPPLVDDQRVDIVLHLLCPLLYGLYAWQVVGWSLPGWCLVVGVRLALFDPVLNWTKGDPAFAVGRSGRLDRLLQRLAGRWTRVSVLSAFLRAVALAAVALLAVGCATSKPAAAPTTADTLVAKLAALTPLQLAQLPRRVQRQYRKNLRAQPRTVPLIQGRAAVHAPLATTVQAAYKPRGPLVQADSGAAVNVAESRRGPAVAGNGNKVTAPAAEHWFRPFVPWVLGVGGVLGLYWLWPWVLALLRRRRGAE